MFKESIVAEEAPEGSVRVPTGQVSSVRQRLRNGPPPPPPHPAVAGISGNLSLGSNEMGGPCQGHAGAPSSWDNGRREDLNMEEGHVVPEVTRSI